MTRVHPFAGVPAPEKPGDVYRIGHGLGEAVNEDEIVYFPKSLEEPERNPNTLEYIETDIGGISKEQVIQDPELCAIPGWSIVLDGDAHFAPESEEGKTSEERRPLKKGRHPQQYLEDLLASEYRGETGLTPEDALIKFLTHLAETNEITFGVTNHIWTLGASFIEDNHLMYMPRIFWKIDSGFGAYESLNLDSYVIDGSNFTIGAATVVRLPG